MQRRSAIGTLVGALAGLSLGEVPNLAAAPLSNDGFSVTPDNLADGSSRVTCSMCHEVAGSLDLTPAGLCLACADAHPEVRAQPESDPFWVLSPREIQRLEGEIQSLASRLDGMNVRLLQLQEAQGRDGSGAFDRAMEKAWGQWHATQRELHLLHLLRAASRQFA